VLVGEGPHLLAVDADHAHQLLFLQQWYDQQSPSACKLGESALRVIRLRQQIVDMDNVLCPGEAAKGSFRMGVNDRFTLPQLGVGRRRAAERKLPEATIFIERHRGEVRLAYARRVFQHRLEYRFQFTGRTGDDAQHFRGRRLLFHSLSSRVRACTSSNSRTFWIAMAA